MIIEKISEYPKNLCLVPFYYPENKYKNVLFQKIIEKNKELNEEIKLNKKKYDIKEYFKFQNHENDNKKDKEKELEDENIEYELYSMKSYKKYINFEKTDNFNINSDIKKNKKEIILPNCDNSFNISKISFSISSNKKNEINDCLKKLTVELNEEKTKCKKLENEINRLTNLLNEEKSKIKSLKDKINSNKQMNELEIYRELYSKDKKITELNKKLSKFPFELNEDEKIISIIFSYMDESIMGTIICKNNDKFSIIENQIYQKYPEYEGKIYFMINGININKDKNLEENEIYDNSIIYLININQT